MPAPTEATASSLLRPYFRLARLFAATAKWQSLTGTGNEEAALPTISFPDYRVLDEGNSVRVPLIVISNPADLEYTFYKKPDAQGRNNNGQLLVTFVMSRDESIEEAIPQERERLQLQQFTDDVGRVIDQALALAQQLRPDPGDGYYQNLENFTIAWAAVESPLQNLSGIDRDNEDEDPKPQVVMTASFVAHLI
ncbi:MAG: hypothetical protein ACKV2Q_24845 [Planctomycetaceae bacterium]